jgi:uncharacterized protein YjgD (DUF1641 family)
MKKLSMKAIVQEQGSQIRILRNILEQTRKETGELERVKAELADAVDILTRFREEHRERSAEIDGLIQRTRLIANERAHLVLAGTDLLREVRYMARQLQRMSGNA